MCSVVGSLVTARQITSFNGSGNTFKYQTETQFQLGECFGKTQREMYSIRSYYLPH